MKDYSRMETDELIGKPEDEAKHSGSSVEDVGTMRIKLKFAFKG